MIVDTLAGPYEFEPVHLERGRAQIDRENAGRNLRLFKQVMDSAGLHFGLIYGTLLGVVREGNFIEYDEDVDVFILLEERDRFLSLLFDLRKVGLELVRYTPEFASLMKDGDYIDIYFFRKTLLGKRECLALGHPSYQIENLEEIEFLGDRYRTPTDPVKFLEDVYGKDWRTPKRNSHAGPNTLRFKLKSVAKKLIARFA